MRAPSTADEHALAFAPPWPATPKVVFSATLQDLDHNARVIGGDPPAQVAEPKAAEGHAAHGRIPAGRHPDRAASSSTLSSWADTPSSWAEGSGCSCRPPSARA